MSAASFSKAIAESPPKVEAQFPDLLVTIFIRGDVILKTKRYIPVISGMYLKEVYT